MSSGNVERKYHMFYGPNNSLFITEVPSDLNCGSMPILSLPPDVYDVYIQVVEENHVSHSLNNIKNIIFHCEKCCYSGSSLYPLLVSQSTMRYLLNKKMDDALRESVYVFSEDPFDEPLELFDEPLDDFFLNILY